MNIRGFWRADTCDNGETIDFDETNGSYSGCDDSSDEPEYELED